MAEEILIPTCPPNASYFVTLSYCYANSLAALPAFETAILQELTCSGGVINTTERLEALRFCTSINESLIITLNDPAADFTSLHDIHFFSGWFNSMLSATLRPMLQVRWRLSTAA